MLQLKLFGSGEAQFQDRPLDGFPYQQPFLLFCYLLINKAKPHHRESLAAVFWGDYPTITARKYLRNNLYRLRSLFESAGMDIRQFLNITEETVAFIDSSQYWLDIEQFDRITSRYQSCKTGDLLPEQADELARAVDLYIGDLLESVYEDWCLYDRERLRLAYLDALSKLLFYNAFHHHYEQGLRYGEQILAIDPTREKVHRYMMAMHWLAGDRFAALAQYKRCVQILRDEIGSRPMPETQLLYEKMVHNQCEPSILPEGDKLDLSNDISQGYSMKDLEQILHYLDHLQDNLGQITLEIQQMHRQISRLLPNKAG